MSLAWLVFYKHRGIERERESESIIIHPSYVQAFLYIRSPHRDSWEGWETTGNMVWLKLGQQSVKSVENCTWPMTGKVANQQIIAPSCLTLEIPLWIVDRPSPIQSKILINCRYGGFPKWVYPKMDIPWYTPKWIVYIGKSIYKRSPLSGATPFSQAHFGPSLKITCQDGFGCREAWQLQFHYLPQRNGVGNCCGFLASRFFLGGIVKP